MSGVLCLSSELVMLSEKSTAGVGAKLSMGHVRNVSSA